MKNLFATLNRFSQVLVTASCLTMAHAASTNIAHVDVERARQLIAEKKVIVLDIRTPQEFAAGHIAGATNIDFRASNFEKSIAALDNKKPYLLHCASGNRSTQALPVFEKLDFKSVYHLDGGIKAWEKAKLPVDKSP